MRWVFILLFLCLTSHLSAASETGPESCRDVDYSDRFVPPRDQGDTGFCYAFTAADLLSEANDIKPPQSISAYQLLSEYIALTPKEISAASQDIQVHLPGPSASLGEDRSASTKDPSLIPAEEAARRLSLLSYAKDYNHNMAGVPLEERDGGFPDLLAGHAMLKKEICLEKEAPSQIILRNSEDPEQTNFIKTKLMKADPVSKFWVDLESSQEMTLRFDKAPRVPKYLNNEYCPEAIRQLPTSLAEDVAPLHDAVTDWAAQKNREKVEQKCKAKAPIKKQPLHRKEYLMEQNTRESYRDINGLLDKGRPFALGYNSCLLTPCKLYKSETDHASMVVGRRWNEKTKSCQIKIKNSWGTECSKPRAGVQCDKGYWWVDLKELSSSTHTVMWIDK